MARATLFGAATNVAVALALGFLLSRAGWGYSMWTGIVLNLIAVFCGGLTAGAICRRHGWQSALYAGFLGGAAITMLSGFGTFTGMLDTICWQGFVSSAGGYALSSAEISTKQLSKGETA